MVYVFLANGFEETEAIAPIDILRRSGAQVKTVGVGSKTVVSSHKITVTADIIPKIEAMMGLSPQYSRLSE